MTDVLTAFQELREAEAAAQNLIDAARLNLGRAIHEARNLPRTRGRLKQEDIASAIDLKRERVRQIERIYEKSLAQS